MIKVGNGLKEVIKVTESDENMLKSGGWGPCVESNPAAKYRNLSVITTRAKSLAEIVENETWSNENLEFIININEGTEELLEDNSLKTFFNTNKIAYIGIGNESNKNDIETFCNKLDNKGIYIDNSKTAEEKYDIIAEFIANKLKSRY